MHPVPPDTRCSRQGPTSLLPSFFNAHNTAKISLRTPDRIFALMQSFSLKDLDKIPPLPHLDDAI